MMSGGWGFGGGMVIWTLLAIAAVVVVIIGVVLLARGLGSQGPGVQNPAQQHPTPQSPEPPREIVKRRYANGEIDKAQYEQLMKDL